LDLRSERLDLQSSDQNAPVVIRFRAWDFLKNPHWDAGTDLAQVPLDTLLKLGRHMGATVPQNIAAQGSVSGSITYNERDGFSGRMAVRDASLTVPDGDPLVTPVAVVDIGKGAVNLEAVTVTLGEKQSAQVEGSYTLPAPGSDEPRSLDLTITT